MSVLKSLIRAAHVTEDFLWEARRRQRVVTLRLRRLAIELFVLAKLTPSLHRYQEQKRAEAANNPPPPWIPTGGTVWNYHQRQMLDYLAPGYIAAPGNDGTIIIVLEYHDRHYEFRYTANGIPVIGW